mmetsp:Transcript_97806/g.169375  ORF Transcript_97806/g.169375 Transcript_97806/m.169375 type:complete len:267 (-) Transcript_97806:488-1288(-)
MTLKPCLFFLLLLRFHVSFAVLLENLIFFAHFPFPFATLGILPLPQGRAHQRVKFVQLGCPSLLFLLLLRLALLSLFFPSASFFSFFGSISCNHFHLPLLLPGGRPGGASLQVHGSDAQHPFFCKSGLQHVFRIWAHLDRAAVKLKACHLLDCVFCSMLRLEFHHALALGFSRVARHGDLGLDYWVPLIDKGVPKRRRISALRQILDNHGNGLLDTSAWLWRSALVALRAMSQILLGATLVAIPLALDDVFDSPVGVAWSQLLDFF